MRRLVVEMVVDRAIARLDATLRLPVPVTAIIADPGYGTSRLVARWLDGRDPTTTLHVTFGGPVATPVIDALIGVFDGAAGAPSAVAVDGLEHAPEELRHDLVRHAGVHEDPSRPLLLASKQADDHLLAAVTPAAGGERPRSQLLNGADLALTTDEVAWALGLYAGERLDAAMAQTKGWPRAVLELRRRASREPVADLGAPIGEAVAYVRRAYVAHLSATARRALRLVALLGPSGAPGPFLATVGPELVAEVQRLAVPQGLVFSDGDDLHLHPILLESLLVDADVAVPAGSDETTGSVATRRPVAGEIGRAEAIDRSAGHVLQESLDLVLTAGPRQAYDQFKHIPGVASKRGAELSLHYAALSLVVGDHQTAAYLLERPPIADVGAPGVRVMADLVRAFLGSWTGSAEAALAAALRAGAALDGLGDEVELPITAGISDVPSARRVARAMAARHALSLLRWDDAATYLAPAIQDRPGRPIADYTVAAIASWTFALRGELEPAGAHLAAALEVMARFPAIGEVAVEPHVAHAEVLLARGEPEEAFRAGERALAGARRLNAPNQQAYARVAMAEALLHGSDPIGALAALTPLPRARLEQLGHKAAALRAQCLVRLDRVDEARWALAGHPVLTHTAVAHAELIAHGHGAVDPGDLLSWNVTGLPAARVAKHAALAALWHGARPDEADRALAVAWSIADEHGCLAPLRLAGPRRSTTGPVSPGRSGPVREASSPAALSPREAAVLARLAEPGGPAKVALDLYISQNTLKTHSRHIYRKLGVGGRTEAVAVARRLGLV